MYKVSKCESSWDRLSTVDVSGTFTLVDERKYLGDSRDDKWAS
jgi:hypothetical protein